MRRYCCKNSCCPFIKLQTKPTLFYRWNVINFAISHISDSCVVLSAYKMPNNKKIQKKILPSQPTLDKFYSSNGVTRRKEPCYLEKYVDEKLASASGNSVPDVSQNISATRDNFTFCADRQKPYEGGNIADSGSIDDCQLLLPIATSSIIKNVPKQLPEEESGDIVDKYAELEQKCEKLKKEKQSLIKLTLQQAHKIATLEKSLEEVRLMVPHNRPTYYRDLAEIDYMALKNISNKQANDMIFIKQWLNILYKCNLDQLKDISLYGTVTRTIRNKLFQGKTAMPAEQVQLIRQSFFDRVERSNDNIEKRNGPKHFNRCFKDALRAIVRTLDSTDEDWHPYDNEAIIEEYEIEEHEIN